MIWMNVQSLLAGLLVAAVVMPGCAPDVRSDGARSTSDVSTSPPAVHSSQGQAPGDGQAGAAAKQRLPAAAVSVAAEPAPAVSAASEPAAAKAHEGTEPAKVAGTAVAALLKEAPAANQQLQFSAVVVGKAQCPVCDPGIQCKPCNQWMLVGDSVDALVPQTINVAHAPVQELKKGARYQFTGIAFEAAPTTLTLSLRPGEALSAPGAALRYLGHK